ncbi:MAG: hypothetical protein E6Q98_24365 [Rhodospirillaceae bacterium]|nr:MAG: hypothetical protein E6Q98_24365 [Rhodospirillaceae bacterium]
MKRLLALAMLAGLLTGCISSDQQVYGQIDRTEKTITVPPGNAMLVGELKGRLHAAGWKLVVDRGPDKISGTMGETTELESYSTYNTRYRLLIAQTFADYCMLGGKVINYNLSLIDNKTGEEVMAQSGRDCTGPAADKFMSSLDAK